MEKIETLHLHGENSKKLYYNLFIPTKKYIQEVIEINKKISNGINIEAINDGFIATVNDLDLSFLNN